MTPVMQTETGKYGDCFPACLATVFDIALSEIPNFHRLSDGDEKLWWAAVRDWLYPRGFGLITIAIPDLEWLSSVEGYLIVYGQSPRGLSHATVWRDGKMVHDPHPDGGGIEPEGIDLLYPLLLKGGK